MGHSNANCTVVAVVCVYLCLCVCLAMHSYTVAHVFQCNLEEYLGYPVVVHLAIIYFQICASFCCYGNIHICTLQTRVAEREMLASACTRSVAAVVSFVINSNVRLCKV